MKKEEIKKLFPKRFYLEDAIEKPIGLNLLKTFIPQELWEETFWGSSIGHVSSVKLKTEQIVLFEGSYHKIPLYLDSTLKFPTEIIFELR